MPTASWSFPFTKGASIGGRDSRGDPQGSIRMFNAWIDPQSGLPSSRPPWRRIDQDLSEQRTPVIPGYPYADAPERTPWCVPRGYSEYYPGLGAFSAMFAMRGLDDTSPARTVTLVDRSNWSGGLARTRFNSRAYMATISGSVTPVESPIFENRRGVKGRMVANGPLATFALVPGFPAGIAPNGLGGGIIEYQPVATFAGPDTVRAVGGQDTADGTYRIGSYLQDIAYQGGRLWALYGLTPALPNRLRWTSAGGITFDTAAGGGALDMVSGYGASAGSPIGLAPLGDSSIIVAWQNAVQAYRVTGGGSVVPAPTGTLSGLTRVDELAGLGTSFPQCLLSAGDSVIMLSGAGLYRFSSEDFKEGLDIQPLSPQWNETAAAWYRRTALQALFCRHAVGSLWVQEWRTAFFFARSGDLNDLRTSMLVVQFPEDGEAVVAEWDVGFPIEALYWRHFPREAQGIISSARPYLWAYGAGRFFVLGSFPRDEIEDSFAGSAFGLRADTLEGPIEAVLETNRLPLGGEGLVAAAKRVTAGLAYRTNAPISGFAQGEWAGIPAVWPQVGVAYAGTGGLRLTRFAGARTFPSVPPEPQIGEEPRAIPITGSVGGTAEAMSIVVQSTDARLVRFGVQWAAIDFTKGGRAVSPNR